jgi:uncharacterized protein (TIGR02452 family)
LFWGGDTELLTPAALADLVEQAPAADDSAGLLVEVTRESTQAACYRLLAEPPEENRIAGLLALNFASAKNPGGGFLNRARAQEEDLCRASALYSCLLAAPQYYAANRVETRTSGLALYTDHMILSPGVPFFRAPDHTLLPDLRLVSILTAPAPNTGATLRSQPDAGPAIEQAFRRRIAMVLALAAACGYRRLVLGAWGCGAFRGDPQLVAGIFAEELSGRFHRAFQQITFAILARTRPGRRNLAAFERTFQETRPAEDNSPLIS